MLRFELLLNGAPLPEIEQFEVEITLENDSEIRAKQEKIKGQIEPLKDEVSVGIELTPILPSITFGLYIRLGPAYRAKCTTYRAQNLQTSRQWYLKNRTHLHPLGERASTKNQ